MQISDTMPIADDWQLCLSPRPVTDTLLLSVPVSRAVDNDIQECSWQGYATRYFKICHQPEQQGLALKLAEHVDGIYELLCGRSLVQRSPFIHVFLVPDTAPKSRCNPVANSIRTGTHRGRYQRGLPDVLGSVCHELTHLFNFASRVPQNDWSGEFMCINFQTQVEALLSAKCGSRLGLFLKHLHEELPQPLMKLFSATKTANVMTDRELFSGALFWFWVEIQHGPDLVSEMWRVVRDKGSPQAVFMPQVINQLLGMSAEEVNSQLMAFACEGMP